MKTQIYLNGFAAGKCLQAAGLRPDMNKEDDREWLDGYREGVAAKRRRNFKPYEYASPYGADDRRSHSR